MPESPSFLLARDRPKEAEAALQWLRGWVSPSVIHNEFTELQEFSRVSNACTDCSKRAIKCFHPAPSFWEKIKEIRRKRNAKPFALCFGLYFLYQFSLVTVWQPYIIQVLKALGTPLDANLVTLINASLGTIGSTLLMLSIRRIGRRKIYLTAIMIVTICSFGLGVYGMVFLPVGWTSFIEDDGTNSQERVEHIKHIVGNYSYFALAIIFIMNFTTRFAIGSMPSIFASEVFPFK